MALGDIAALGVAAALVDAAGLDDDAADADSDAVILIGVDIVFELSAGPLVRELGVAPIPRPTASGASTANTVSLLLRPTEFDGSKEPVA